MAKKQRTITDRARDRVRDFIADLERLLVPEPPKPAPVPVPVRAREDLRVREDQRVRRNDPYR